MSRLNNNLKITVFLKAVIKAMAEEILAPSNNTYFLIKQKERRRS
jgi:hypothetical protein